MNSFSKPPPNLCDLPLEIVEMIMDRLDLRGRITVGRVCKTLRKIVNGLKPYRCNHLKIKVVPDIIQVIIDGCPIEYRNSEGEHQRVFMRITFHKMLDDVLPFIQDLQLNTLSVFFYDYISNNLFNEVFKQRSQSLTVNTLISKGFDIGHWYLSPHTVDWASIRFCENHIFKKHTDDIIKVQFRRAEPTGEMPDPWETFTAIDSIKYYREGQEDIYVDDPELLNDSVP